MLRELLLIGFAGMLGALGRYGVGTWSQKIFGENFPYGTLIVNVLGGLLIGFVMQLEMDAQFIPKAARTAVAVGFLGSFTTFSTFSFETMSLFEKGDRLNGALNVVANLLLCLIAAGIGMAAGRMLFGNS